MKQIYTSRAQIALMVCFTLVAAPQLSYAAKAQPPGTKIGMKYEGGSVDFSQHDGLNVFVSPETVTLVQGKKSEAIPVKAINEISYGNDVHRRVGAAVGVGLVTFGIGAMMLLVKTKKHYVGMTWK